MLVFSLLFIHKNCKKKMYFTYNGCLKYFKWKHKGLDFLYKQYLCWPGIKYDNNISIKRLSFVCENIHSPTTYKMVTSKSYVNRISIITLFADIFISLLCIYLRVLQCVFVYIGNLKTKMNSLGTHQNRICIVEYLNKIISTTILKNFILYVV